MMLNILKHFNHSNYMENFVILLFLIDMHFFFCIINQHEFRPKSTYYYTLSLPLYPIIPLFATSILLSSLFVHFFMLFNVVMTLYSTNFMNILEIAHKTAYIFIEFIFFKICTLFTLFLYDFISLFCLLNTY